MSDRHMKDSLESIARRGVPENTNLWPDISARLLKRKTFMQTLRARPLMAALITLLILLALSGVVYAVGRSLGYIPGIGVVETDSALRTLEEPFTIARENIELNIEQVVASSDKTVIVYNYVVPAEDSMANLFPGESTDAPALALPDGTRLSVQVGRRMPTDGLATDQGTPIRYSLEFPSLPVDVMEVTLVLHSLPPLAVGPTSWQIPLKLVPAPEGTVLPVYEIHEAGAGNEPVAEASPSSEVSPANPAIRHGITASLDLYVPLEDGVLLIGSLHWSEQDYPAYAVRPENIENIQVADATGKEVSSEPSLGAPEKPEDESFRTYWALKLLEKDFVAPLKITINSASVDTYPKPFVFQFDPGPNPTPGQSWDLDQEIQIGDIQARIVKASLMDNNGLAFQFDVRAKPNELADVYIGVSINQCMGGGGSIPTEPSELLQAYVPICRTELPPGPFDVQVQGGLIWGPWQVEWTQPETSSITPPVPTATPLSHSEACVNVAKFKQALAKKPALPAGFGGRVILYGPYQGNNNLWKSTVSNLDGSDPRLLGDGDGSFSPDGSKVAFSRRMDGTAEQGIFITDLTTNQTFHLPGTLNFDFNPIWSPDGSQIVFNRGGNSYDLFIIHTDGTNLRPLTSSQGQEYPVGWMPDGQHLLYTLPGATYQYTNHIVDIQTGQTEYFSDDEFLAMSPDAKYKLTAEREPSNMDIWVTYLSTLDGSNRWALAESDVILSSAFWSQDGEWLLVSVFMRDDQKYIPAFVHLTDCQIIPLPKLDGIIVDWRP